VESTDWIERLLHQENRTSTLDFARDLPMQMRRHPSDSARQNLAAFGHKFFEQIRIFIVNGLRGYIDTTARHNPVRPPEIRSAFGVFRFHELILSPDGECVA